LPIASPGGSFSRIDASPCGGTAHSSSATLVPSPGVRSIAGCRSPIDQMR
jgi:hypothetical protein